MATDLVLTDEEVRALAGRMMLDSEVITPTMVENYLRNVIHRLDVHTSDIQDAANALAVADSAYSSAHGRAYYLEAPPGADGKPMSGVMRDAYADVVCAEEYAAKTVAEARFKSLQEAGRNLRQAAECGRSVSASVRGNL